MKLGSARLRRVSFALAAALFTAAGTAHADVAIRFGWSTTDAETDSYRFTAHAFADALEAAKPGYFKVSFFPNRQLGEEREMMQGLQLGTVDAALITNSVVANVEGSFTVNDLPFLYPNAETAFKVLDSKLGVELFTRLKPKRVQGLAWCDSGFRNMINGVRPITSVADLKGLKFRVIESPLFVRMFTLLDSAGVPMPFGEVFTALQQGTIDGMENPTWNIVSARFDELVKNFSITRHIYSAIPILMSGRLFDRLSDEDKKVVQQAAQTACEKQRVFNAKAEKSIIEGMAKRGVKINEVADMTPFQDRVKPIYDEYRPKIGADLVDRWLEGVKQAK